MAKNGKIDNRPLHAHRQAHTHTRSIPFCRVCAIYNIEMVKSTIHGDDPNDLFAWEMPFHCIYHKNYNAILLYVSFLSFLFIAGYNCDCLLLALLCSLSRNENVEPYFVFSENFAALAEQYPSLEFHTR